MDYLTYQYFVSGFTALTSSLASLNTKVDRLTTQLTVMQTQENTMATTVQDIKDQADKALAAIASESDKDDSIIALVAQETAMIAALRDQLAQAIASGATPEALQAVLDSMKAAEASALTNAQKVVDAVNANTPNTPPSARTSGTTTPKGR